MQLYLLRHAESISNEKRQARSEPDEPLSQLGSQQAIALGDHLAKLNLDKILCSTLLRAKQTIDPYLQKHPIPTEYHDALIEGQLVLSNSQLDEKETLFLQRAKLAVNLITDQTCERILVVSHGHMIRELINLLLSLPCKVRFPHENCGLSLIDISETISVKYVNKNLFSND